LRTLAGNGIPVVERKLFSNNHLKTGISARGGLEPHFGVLFSAIFHGISLENFHRGRNLWKVAEAKVWSILVKSSTFCIYVLIVSSTSPLPIRRIARRTAESTSGQLVEKEIKGRNPVVSGNDEISLGISWRLTRSARYPLDPPAIAQFLGMQERGQVR